MSLSNGHVPVKKYPDLMFLGVNEFDSDWLTVQEMSHSATADPVFYIQCLVRMAAAVCET
jgi:hypothetical protein